MLYSETNALHEFERKCRYICKSRLDIISTTFVIITQEKYNAMSMPRQERKKIMISLLCNNYLLIFTLIGISGAMNYIMAP